MEQTFYDVVTVIDPMNQFVFALVLALFVVLGLCFHEMTKDHGKRQDETVKGQPPRHLNCRCQQIIDKHNK